MRILLATADTDLRLSLELLLNEQPGVQIVGTVSEGDGLRALMHTTRSQLIIADWDLPGLPLTAVIDEARQMQPPITTILLVNSDKGFAAVRNSGADAIVAKGTPPDHLLTAIRQQSQVATKQETIINE